MNARIWITHGLAVVAGFAVTFAFAGKGSTEADSGEGANERGSVSKRAGARPAAIRPREMLRSLATVPMESQERERLKSEIYSEWSKQDPIGFLAYFEHRPWFDYMGDNHPFQILAMTQPEELLAYARRTGCKDAASALVEYADPVRVLDLLKLDGCERFPKDLLEKLAKRGEEMDPGFHEKLAAISDPEARRTALEEAATAMKDAGRTEDLFRLLQQYPEALESLQAGRSLGELLLLDHRDLGRLDSLKDEVREAAVGEIISSLHDDRVSEQGQREILAELAKRGYLDSRWKEVFETVMDAGDVSSESAVAWKDWALSLPGGDETRSLQLASMVLWSTSTKAEADDFAALPEGELRDGAVVGGVGRYLQDENLPEARKMIGLIGDPGLRDKMEAYLTLMEKGEEPEDFDPFGFGPK